MIKMSTKQKNKQKTVAEKVVDTLLHPNRSGSDSDSEDEVTAARVVECDDEDYEFPKAGTTEFRKRTVKMLSEQSAKYKGKIASRKDFESDDDDDDNDEYNVYTPDDEEDKDISGALKNKGKQNNQDYYSCSEEDRQSDNEAGDESGNDDYDDDECESDNDDTGDENSEVISKINHEAEIQKGLCVQNQLRIWERLLELRINLQKLVNKANQLPAPQELKILERNNIKYKEVQQLTCKQTCQLLQNLLLLQTNLSTQFLELNRAIKPSLKRTSPFKDACTEEPPLKQINQYLQESFENFRSYRNSVLLKWDDRTKLLQTGTGTKNKALSEDYSIIKKIDNTLMNKSVLIKKSQKLQSTTQTESKNDVNDLGIHDENYINFNFYDDSDFYHQQLRELIEYKANTSSNMSEITKQFLELQKLRQKMKKKVDTRASKGRKLRYVIHNKLINFIAPYDNTIWSLDSLNELCKSLFV